MRHVAALVVLAAAVLLAAGAGPARATNECRGFMVCVPVAGPWVVLPKERSMLRRSAEYQLSCPRGYVVAGLDAELSHRTIEIGFLGLLGSPVNPGITTSRAVVFAGRYVGAAARAVSFRPHIGCVPGAGGGRRVPTSAARVYPPGQPTIRRVRTVRLDPGHVLVVSGCATGERLVTASHAVGFFTPAPPGPRLAASVSATRIVHRGRIRVTVRVGAATRGVRSVLQVSAVCAGAE